MDKLLKADIGGVVTKNFYEVKVLFLPGLTFMMHSLIATVAALTIACIWFAIYFQFIYKNDYEEIEGGRWDKRLADLDPIADAHNENLRIRPDVILVFHHPEYEYADQTTKTTAHEFDRVMVPSQGMAARHLAKAKSIGHAPTPRDKDYLERMTVLQKAAHENPSQSDPVWSYSPCCAGSGNKEETGESGAGTFRDARIALLQDLFHDLYDMGFGLKVFSSCDEDEIFLAIRLRKVEAIRHYLYLQQYSLRINRQIIPKLGIGQP